MPSLEPISEFRYPQSSTCCVIEQFAALRFVVADGYLHPASLLANLALTRGVFTQLLVSLRNSC